MKTYKLFVIFHQELNLGYFDPSVLEHTVFINVNPQNNHRYEQVKVINLYELPGFIPLGKWYTESEVIYNIYKNCSLIDDVEYVGFIHYDIDFTPVNDVFLQNSLSRYDLINFQPYPFKEDYAQNILMDPERPDTLTGKGKNCYITILDDLNSFYKTAHKPDALKEKEINLCACFLLKKELFNDMMLFIAGIIESRKLDRYDSRHKHRIQGGLLERYYGVWGLLKAGKALNYRLKHEFVQTNKDLPFLHKVKRAIAAALSRIKK